MSTSTTYFPYTIRLEKKVRFLSIKECHFIGNYCAAKKKTKELRKVLGKTATVRRYGGSINVYR